MTSVGGTGHCETLLSNGRTKKMISFYGQLQSISPSFSLELRDSEKSTEKNHLRKPEKRRLFGRLKKDKGWEVNEESVSLHHTWKIPCCCSPSVPTVHFLLEDTRIFLFLRWLIIIRSTAKKKKMPYLEKRNIDNRTT